MRILERLTSVRPRYVADIFGNSHFNRLSEMFADQFEKDSQGVLYRKSMKEAPIRVTASERDALVTQFRKRMRLALWSIVVGTVLLLALLVVLLPNTDGEASNVATYAGLTAIVVPVLGVHRWAWNAPARKLDRRPTVGSERNRAEIRRLMLSRMTFGQLAFAVVASVLMASKISDKVDVFHGWGIIWLVFAGVVILGAGIQAVRKWTIERA
jgi:uncharacterized integral membrane protein